MLHDEPTLTHLQQQQAVERIQALMAEGMSSGEAIRLVSAEIRAEHTGERVLVQSEDDEPRDEAAQSQDRYFWSDDEPDDDDEDSEDKEDRQEDFDDDFDDDRDAE